MAETFPKKSTKERLLRFGRDINILGALAIGGVALAIPGPNAFLASWAAWNGVTAGGFEIFRKRAEKKK